MNKFLIILNNIYKMFNEQICLYKYSQSNNLLIINDYKIVKAFIQNLNKNLQNIQKLQKGKYF